ncbi:MAG: hypothetical protein ACXVUE_08990 [Solirubrobacteraceae bacterium]
MSVDLAAQHPAEECVSREQPEAGPCITLGLLLAGRWANEVAVGLGKALEAQLVAQHPSVRWRLKVRNHRLVPLPREAADAIEAARLRMLEEGWDLAVLVTDLPLTEAGRPVLGEVISPTHRVAVISLPALGSRHVRQRLIDALIGIVGDLVGEQPSERERDAAGRRLARRRRRTRLRLAEIAAEPRDPARSHGLFTVLVGLDHARLLWSMVWINRPWRLVAGLYRALIAAVAFVILAIITEAAWKLATELGVARLAFLNGLAVTAMVTAIITAHHLWERPLGQASRRQVALFNWATLLTVALGVVALYLVLLAITTLGTELLVPGRAMREALGRPEHISDYLSLGWLLASLASVGGVLGASLESDAAVRHAVYLTRELRGSGPVGDRQLGGSNSMADHGAAIPPEPTQITELTGQQG